MAGLLASLASSVLGSLDVGSILKGAGRVIGAGAEALGHELSSIGETPAQRAREQKQKREETREEYVPEPRPQKPKGQPYPQAKAKFQHVVYDSNPNEKYYTGQKYKVDERKYPMDIKHKDPVRQKQYEQVKQSYTKRQNIYGREQD